MKTRHAVLRPDGSWLDPEELAYPAGSIRQSRRRAWVRCSDGKFRTAHIGIPDTYFSIPGFVRVCSGGRQLTVFGYVTSDDQGFTFRHYLYERNADALPAWELGTRRDTVV